MTDEIRNQTGESSQLLREILAEIRKQESILDHHRQETKKQYADYLRVVQSPPAIRIASTYLCLFVVITAAVWIAGHKPKVAPSSGNSPFGIDEAQANRILAALMKATPEQQRHLERVVGPHWEQTYGARSGGRYASFPFERQVNEQIAAIFLDLPVDSDEAYRKLSKRERYVWDVCWFEAEVMNGGLDQYFHNDSGNHYAETLEALDAIGAKRTHQLLKKAGDLFPDGHPSPDETTRRAQLETIHVHEGGKLIDDVVEGGFDVDLYRRLLKYWRESQAGAQ